jgi:hypothetical protein
MTMTITRHTQIFIDAAHRVARQEVTRTEAAAKLGVNLGTFTVWMQRSGISEGKNPNGTKKAHGAALGWLTSDPVKAKALEEAVARVLSGELTGTEAAELYPDATIAAIGSRVRAHLKRTGGTPPPRKRRTRLEMAAAALAIAKAEALKELCV